MKKTTTFLKYFSIILLAVFMFSCEKDKDTPNNQDTGNDNNNEGGGDDTTPGYVLTKHLIDTAKPCFVNIMFQVSDMDGNGVHNLVTSDFEVKENSQDVSPTESSLTIKKKDALSYNIKTVLMLDNSASVGTNIDEIKNAALALVDGMVSQQQIAVYVFSENPVLLQDFTSNVQSLKNAINDISLGYATTNLYGSVSTGVSKWSDHYTTTAITQGFMILITDGSDTQASSTLSEALSEVGNKRVYTIGLGSEQDKDALQQLGTAGYYELSNYGELTTKFTEIQNSIVDYANSFYWLYYMSPKRGPNIHTLQLYVKDNANTSSNSYIEGEFSSYDFYSDDSQTPDNPSAPIDIQFNGNTLYVHPADNASDVEWGGYGTEITAGNGADSETDGEANTSAIISQLGSDGHAAYVCDTLTAFGYSDWYLPSKDELNAMYQNKDAIGGSSSGMYWSSTELTNTGAWYQGFDDGNQGNGGKRHGKRVRCVRRD
jgi:hypothetical protein